MATEVASPPAAAVEVYPPPERVQKGAAVTSMEQYREMYERSLRDPEVGRERWSQESSRHPSLGQPPLEPPKPAHFRPLPVAGLLERADGTFSLEQEVGQRRELSQVSAAVMPAARPPALSSLLPRV